MGEGGSLLQPVTGQKPWFEFAKNCNYPCLFSNGYFSLPIPVITHHFEVRHSCSNKKETKKINIKISREAEWGAECNIMSWWTSGFCLFRNVLLMKNDLYVLFSHNMAKIRKYLLAAQGKKNIACISVCLYWTVSSKNGALSPSTAKVWSKSNLMIQLCRFIPFFSQWRPFQSAMHRPIVNVDLHILA